MAIKNYYPKTYMKQYIFKYLNMLLKPFDSQSIQLSMIHHNEVVSSLPTKRLVDLSLAAINESMKNVDISSIYPRQRNGQKWLEINPGEHYYLLAAFIKLMKPKIVIEIGTYLGHASLTIKSQLEKGATLYTFDVFKWSDFQDTCFDATDFDSQLIQYTDDLTKYEAMEKHRKIIQSAEFIFIDALKDGVQELKFIENFRRLGLKDGTILFFDDIRVYNMIKIWNDISMPKMDLTSFGHWSGSGIVEWKN